VAQLLVLPLSFKACCTCPELPHETCVNDLQTAHTHRG
jgi:hypothetical protein